MVKVRLVVTGLMMLAVIARDVVYHKYERNSSSHVFY